MNIIRTILAWRQRRREERAERRRALDRRIVIQRRYREFEASPSRYTRSPWIRSLIASPMWNDARVPGEPRKIGLSHPEKAKGRDYILDMLELERSIRFRGYKPWRGIFSAMADDAIVAGYPYEYRRLLEELRETCPDEVLSSCGSRTHAQGLGIVGGRAASGRGEPRCRGRGTAAFAPSRGLGPAKIAVDFTGQEGYASSMECAIAAVGPKISHLVHQRAPGLRPSA